MAFAQNIEKFRLVDGYDNYDVSSHGRIRNNITNKILRPTKDKDGYYTIDLRKNKKRQTYKLHKLVTFAFCENPNNYDAVDHKDRIEETIFLIIFVGAHYPRIKKIEQ